VLLSVLIFTFLIFLAIQKTDPIVADMMQEFSFPPTQMPSPTVVPIPTSHIIPQKLHIYQSFNNCGPATLSMALSYENINISQSELGKILRPYQIPGGDNDDKSVTLNEVAEQAKVYGLVSYLRPNGTIEKIKQLVSVGVPVVTRTWLKSDEDIGHYRVVRGYDDNTQELIQDDSLQGKNLRISYSEFEKLWVPFNFEYLVIVNDSKKSTIERILGLELETRTAWKNAKTRIEKEIQLDPQNWHLTFALSRIYFYLNDHKKSVEEFDKVENKLSFRTLWYQTEPMYSIYETKDFDRVISITEKILNNHNRAFSELYILRGDIFKSRNQINIAKSEYQKAYLYNINNKEAIIRYNN